MLYNYISCKKNFQMHCQKPKINYFYGHECKRLTNLCKVKCFYPAVSVKYLSLPAEC